jgi:hypothetical protein
MAPLAASRYTTYADVPFYQRQWFFWVTCFLVPPIAVAVLIIGDVYYVRKDELRSFGRLNRALAGLIALFWTYGLLKASFGP